MVGHPRVSITLNNLFGCSLGGLFVVQILIENLLSRLVFHSSVQLPKYNFHPILGGGSE